MLYCLILTFIIVYITDISGISLTLKQLFHLWLFNEKPNNITWSWSDIHPLLNIIDCSKCQTFWAGIITLITINQFSLLSLLCVCLLSYMTPVIKDIYYIINDLFVKTTSLINNILNK